MVSGWDGPLRIVTTRVKGQGTHAPPSWTHKYIYMFICNQTEVGPAKQSGGRKLSVLSAFQCALTQRTDDSVASKSEQQRQKR